MTTPPEENYHSQFGEDKILAEHFAYKTDGCCVEVGAYDGIGFSNSYYFEQVGWKCVLVEPVPQLAERIRVNRPKSQLFQCAVVAPESTGNIGFTVAEDIMALSSISIDSHNETLLQQFHGRIVTKNIQVPARTLDEILDESGITEIDFMTIDVEGHEYDALRGFNIERWKPSILILERNHSYPDWRILMHLYRRQYVLYKITGVNDWYRPKPLTTWETLVYGWGLLERFYIRQLPHYAKMLFLRIRSRLSR